MEQLLNELTQLVGNKYWGLPPLYPPVPLTISVLCPVNTKHLYNICTMLDQRRRRWADVAQVLYKCFVFAGW